VRCRAAGRRGSFAIGVKGESVGLDDEPGCWPGEVDPTDPPALRVAHHQLRLVRREARLVEQDPAERLEDRAALRVDQQQRPRDAVASATGREIAQGTGQLLDADPAQPQGRVQSDHRLGDRPAPAQIEQSPQDAGDPHAVPLDPIVGVDVSPVHAGARVRAP
jgi:hypothetical protein